MTRQVKKIVVYGDETHVPAGVKVGDRVELIRGDGPREGELMAYAVITRRDPDGGIGFKVE